MLLSLIIIIPLIILIIYLIFNYLSNKDNTNIGKAITKVKDEVQAKIKYKLKDGDSYSIDDINDIETEIMSGIYLIYIENSKGELFFYIGQSKDIRSRWLSHKRNILKNATGKLYKQINDYLLENHLTQDKIYFKILEKCEEVYLTERENFWMNEFQSQSLGANTADSKKREAVVIRKEGNEKLIEIFQNYSKDKTIIINLELDGFIVTKGGGEFRKDGNSKVKKFKKDDFIFTKDDKIEKERLDLDDNGDIIIDDKKIEIYNLPSDTLKQLEQLSKKGE